MPYSGPFAVTVFQSQSGKRNKFRVPRSSIRPNTILGELAFRIQSSGFIKADPFALHDLFHLTLALLIKPSPRIPRCEVSSEIEISGRKAVLDITGEAGRKSVVKVLGDGYPMNPMASCEVKSFSSQHSHSVTCEEGALPVAMTRKVKEIE
jgi:hypothetical protein